ncbi:hypothetical protein AVEN_202860-1 [Araneus ventricosus]|uniref:Uncharacterized protein n=1 Tax=Araneus ventricosus TaxID=182803 RepID=A0A4Y2R4L2_ARAVE|nr:hypothetical protein AVEN_202860-1 [Araneus ventricosus]
MNWNPFTKQKVFLGEKGVSDMEPSHSDIKLSFRQSKPHRNPRFNPLIPKTIGIKAPQNTGKPGSYIKDKGNSLPPQKPQLTVQILRPPTPLIPQTHLGDPL